MGKEKHPNSSTDAPSGYSLLSPIQKTPTPVESGRGRQADGIFVTVPRAYIDIVRIGVAIYIEQMLNP